MPDRRLQRAFPLTLVLLVAVVGLAWIATGHWRRGVSVLAAAAGIGAVLRLVLPQRAVGPLGVRGRAFDVLFLGVLAALFAVGATVGFS